MKTLLKVSIQLALLPVSIYLFGKVFLEFGQNILALTNSMFAALAAISALCFTAGSSFNENKEIKSRYLHAGVLFFRASMLAIVASVINFGVLEYEESLLNLYKTSRILLWPIGGACGVFAYMAILQGHIGVWKLSDVLYES